MRRQQHGFQRRLKAFASGAVIVVVETVDRQVVRVGRSARKRESAGFFRRVCVIDVTVFSKLARREWLFSDAGKCEQQIEN